MVALETARPLPPHGKVRGRQAAEPFALKRLGVVMTPDEDNPMEAEGAFNPAAARGPDGHLYLFPRLVAKGNYSRIGIARVIFSDEGEPMGVERLGVALEPQEPYEKNPLSGGGCEDPRITFLEPFQRYVMTYTAFSPLGPRIALAVSQDLMSWQRLGLVNFTPLGPVDLNTVDNKDAVVFPTLLPDPRTGEPSIGFIHRPYLMGSPAYLLMRQGGIAASSRKQPVAAPRRADHPSIWISYSRCPGTLADIGEFHAHHRLVSPAAGWEGLKVGAGVPPIRTQHGWLIVYHGVAGREGPQGRVRYMAGAVVLDAENPHRLTYRTRHPVLALSPEDNHRWPNIVFPTGHDRRTDIGQPDRVDIYYGVADHRVGVATLTVPGKLGQARVA